VANKVDAFVTPRVPATTTTTTTATISKLAATIEKGPTITTSTPFETTVAAVPKIAQRWRKSTKQVATLGPASESVEMIETLFLAGADVFRLNFSHGSQEQKKELLDMIRSVEEKYSHPIAVLGDLQGPKLRVSRDVYTSLLKIIKISCLQRYRNLCSDKQNPFLLLILYRLENFPILRVKF